MALFYFFEKICFMQCLIMNTALCRRWKRTYSEGMRSNEQKMNNQCFYRTAAFCFVLSGSSVIGFCDNGIKSCCGYGCLARLLVGDKTR